VRRLSLKTNKTKCTPLGLDSLSTL
jgi:hypothetical protein